MSGWSLAFPWALIALPLPWLLWRWLPAATPGQALKLPHPHLQLATQHLPSSRRLLPWLLALAWVCLVIAAAQPQRLGPPLAQEHSGRALLLAVDLSGSMQTRDMVLGGQAVNRFQAVQAIASDFIERRKGDELGLVLFGSQAYLVTPLTYDLSAVAAQLQSAQIGIAGQQTAIGDAIAIATKRLMALPLNQRVLVLLTDGVNTSGSLSPESAAAAAKTAGVRIYTIGVGANQLQVPGLFGSMTVNPSAELDARLLTQIAKSTGGEFFRATDTQSLAAAYHAIDQLEPTKQKGEPLRLPQTGFRLPLALGLGLLLLAWLLALWQSRSRTSKEAA